MTEQQAREARVGFMYAGLPGSGKTEAAEFGADVTGGTRISSGDIIRRAFREERPDDEMDSKTLAEFAARKREQNGHSFMSEQIVGRILRDDIDAEYPIHVDAMRHVDGLPEFREFLDASCLILVKAPFNRRLGRLKERGREGEDEFGPADLMERDRVELNDLGAETLLDYSGVDVVVDNDTDNISKLYNDLLYIYEQYGQRNNPV